MIKDLSNIKDSMFKFRRERALRASDQVDTSTADGVTERVVKTV